MNGGLIDISVQLRVGMPIWPDSTGIQLSQPMRIADGAAANVTRLEMDVHCGTHVEGPLHFLAEGIPLDQMPLETFYGPALVVDFGIERSITPALLERAEIPPGTERLLLRTTNSDLWTSTGDRFETTYTAITAPAANWLVSHGIRLVGIDYLSIQRFRDGPETHRILLRADVAILEGLDLTNAPAGRYTLLCLPLKVKGSEAAPVRAVLLPEGTSAR